MASNYGSYTLSDAAPNPREDFWSTARGAVSHPQASSEQLETRGGAPQLCWTWGIFIF